jgi:hypothetical protein
LPDGSISHRLLTGQSVPVGIGVGHQDGPGEDDASSTQTECPACLGVLREKPLLDIDTGAHFWILPISTRTDPCLTFSNRARFLTSDSASPMAAICVRSMQKPLYECRAGRIRKIRETVHP